MGRSTKRSGSRACAASFFFFPCLQGVVENFDSTKWQQTSGHRLCEGEKRRVKRVCKLLPFKEKGGKERKGEKKKECDMLYVCIYALRPQMWMDTGRLNDTVASCRLLLRFIVLKQRRHQSLDLLGWQSYNPSDDEGVRGDVERTRILTTIALTGSSSFSNAPPFFPIFVKQLSYDLGNFILPSRGRRRLRERYLVGSVPRPCVLPNG